MPFRGKCPGESVYESGKIRVEGRAATEDGAFAAMEAMLPQAKRDADAASTKAFRAALGVGDAGCREGEAPCEKCNAVYLVPPHTGPWRGGAYQEQWSDDWVARGGYYWKVLVICECEQEEKKREKVEAKH